MTHDELRDLSGGYALGVLDEPERTAFEAHLATCAACAAEVRELTDVAIALALDAPQIEPPAALRARVLQAATANAHAASSAPGIVSIGAHRRPSAAPQWRKSVLAVLSAAAVLAALATGIYAASLLRRIEALEQQLRAAADREAQSQRQVVQLRASSDAAGDAAAEIRRILAAGDLRRVELAGTKAAPAASGRGFWSPTQGLVVAFANLPPTDSGRVYQLWVIPPGGAPIGAGLLNLEPEGRALALAPRGTTGRVGTVAITLEPAGGSVVPTLSNMIAAGNVAN